MNRSKNISLAVILGLLILTSVGLSYWDKSGSTTKIDSQLFVVDNLDQVDRIVITHQQQVLDCRASTGGFMVNNEFIMDQNMLTLLAAVLQSVRVQRPITGSEQTQLVKDIKESGSHIEIYSGDQLEGSFWAGGDRSEQISYFVTEEGQAYVVHLPGYNSDVSGLFRQPISSWRSRNVFQNTWRSLLTYDFQDFNNPENDFQISYNDPFFKVSTVQQLDSNNVMNYLQQVVALKATSLIDTTYSGMPWVEISTTDIDPQKNQSLTLYGDETKSTILGKVGEQYMMFTTSSIKHLFQDAKYFEKTEE